MWILRGNSTKILYLLLLIFVIILSSYPLYTTAAIRTFTHNEEIDYGPTLLPRVWDSRVFDDGTMLIRIARRNPNVQATASNLCFMEMISLRMINTDGTVIEKDYKNLDIPSYNYCVSRFGGFQFFDFIKYEMIRKNQILITYYNATDPNDVNTFSEWGMVIDLDGNIIDRTIFGPALTVVDDSTQKRIVLASSQLQLNINREKGFLRYNGKTDSLSLEWQQYKIETNGIITKLTFGEINLYSPSASVVAMQTVDESYALAFANTTNSFNATTPLSPQGQLFILPIGFNQTSVSPLLLYQTPLPNLSFPSLICNVAFVGVGEVCTLSAIQKDPAGTLPDKTFYIKVNFLSSGSVSSFQVLNNVLPVENVIPIWTVNSLTFGGYLLVSTVVNQTSLVGYLFQENSDVPIPWEFPNPLPTNLRSIYEILPNNNTLLVSQMETSNSWGFQIIDLPKFSGNLDKGYSNLNIESTVPLIQSTINPDLDKITINFYEPIVISTGKLSIYHVDGDKTYLRQSFQSDSDSLNVENDGKTITGKILDSTFSVKGSYFIQMDNNFVRNRAYREPMLGIRDNVWNFTTVERKDRFSPSTTGLLRLSTEGTRYYDSLSSNQQHDFFNNLLNDISYAIPVTRARLSSNERIQVDNSVNEKQYLISIGIKETRNEDEVSVATAVKNLATMVTNKDQTPIGEGQTTRYLDEAYSFVPSPNLWEKYKFRLLGVFLIVGLLMVLFLFAQRRDSNGNNIAVLQLGVIIFDLVMDILFVSSNARDVPFLYIPSVIFITLPIGLNTILAFTIITQENNANPKFLQWFTAHGKVASVFTVLAGADIEALNILHSNLAGFPFFRAPLSDDARSKIFWGACVNIFTEDIPQVIIQVLYRYNTVSYDNLIPLLTLVSSAVNLTINIIGRLYQGTNRLRNKDGSNYDNNDSDDFGGLVSSDTGSNNKRDLEKLEEGETTTREVPVSESSSQKNYLGDVLKLDSSDEKLGDSVLKKSYNVSNGNLDSNKNQSNKGITFLKRMVSRKE